MEYIEKYYEREGYDRMNYNPPKPIYKWVGYLGGEVKTFDGDNAEEQARAFSKNVEKIIVNKEEIRCYNEIRREKESRAIELFLTDMREEFDNLTDGQYAICYSYAYDRGHSGGMNEVLQYMYHYDDFIQRILKAE